MKFPGIGHFFRISQIWPFFLPGPPFFLDWPIPISEIGIVRGRFVFFFLCCCLRLSRLMCLAPHPPIVCENQQDFVAPTYDYWTYVLFLCLVIRSFAEVSDLDFELSIIFFYSTISYHPHWVFLGSDNVQTPLPGQLYLYSLRIICKL